MAKSNVSTAEIRAIVERQRAHKRATAAAAIAAAARKGK